MGETTISSKALEEAMLKALPSLFPNLLGTTSSPRVDFYDKFQREADEHDRDFTKKYDDDLNTTLIFAGLFSAVATGFIVDVQQKLEPDYQEMGYTVLEIIANSSLGRIDAGSAPPFPRWNGPDPTVVHVQAILYSSLATSLLAAFLAMLGKQWLNRYGQTEMHGSVIERSQQRQRKINGMDNWHFPLVMECLPLMLQAALLLLGYALSNYLFSLDKVVAGVTIGFSAFGVLFYLIIVAAATSSYNCPFQTPPSLIFRLLVRLDSRHKKYLKRTGKLFGRVFSRKKQPRPGAFDRNGAIGHTTIPMAIPSDQLPPFFNKEPDLGGYVLDSKCIAWMFDKSTDADVIMAIMKFIPEVVWHDKIQTIPLERLYDTVLECFDRSSGNPVVFSKLRNKAYLSAKALLHLAIQRKCIRVASDEDVFESISNRHQILGSGDCETNPELESTLRIIDRIFGVNDSKPIPWQKFTFTAPHHTWMGRILLCRAWHAIGNREPLPDDVKEFVLHSLQSEPPPPTMVVADCLFIIGLALGIELPTDDSSVVGMSATVNSQTDKIYERLTDMFDNYTPATDEINSALEAMRLIAPLSDRNGAQKSYNLFRAVMRAPVSEEKKWDAARLAMHGAYKSDKFLPPVEDPQDILAFLDHHFGPVTGGSQYQDEPVQNALRALAYASGPATIESLENFDPTRPPFVHGIRDSYQGNKPLQLRKAAFFFLRFISNKWFDTPNKIMEPDQMKSFCTDWASTMDDLEDTDDVKKAALTVLFEMINSPHWRPHIVAEKWGLLESFALVPGDSQPLRKCLGNLVLMDEVKTMGNTAATALWLRILWLKYGELNQAVQKKLEEATKGIAQGRRRTDLEKCLSAVESELKEVERAATKYSTFSTDPTAVALKARIANLEQAKKLLTNLKR